ncbi:MAG: autotransporter-associated beta strand repeat-containing protein [Luteolibacter sp.]
MINHLGALAGAFAQGTGDRVISLQKEGAATLTLTNNGNAYTGATTVSAGSLLVNGSLGDTAVTVNSAATIGGNGSLGGSLGLDAASFFEVVDFNNPLAVTGTITLGSGFGIDNLLGIDWDTLDLDTPYTLISTSQTFGTGSIDNFGLANAVSVGNSGRQAYFTNGSLAVVVIPEPSSALFGSLSLLLLLRRRR